MIRSTVINQITKYISESDFLVNDFETKVNTRNRAPELTISYKHNPKYYFRALFQNDSIIKIVLSPGKLILNETYDITGQYDLMNKLDEWLHSLKEELLSLPQYREIVQHSAEIEEITKKFEGLLKDIPNEYITKDEGQKFSDALDELQRRFTEHYQQELDNDEQTKTEIKNLQSEIKLLKDTMYSLEKRQWLGSLIARLVNWMSDPKNKNILKAGKNVVMALLPENASDIIDVGNSE